MPIGEPIHHVSVAGVVIDERGHVLLIQRRDNARWEAPGGVLELRETFEQGVAREVLEETGVAVEVQRLSGVYKNMPRGIVALVYRCLPVGGEPRPSAEAVQARWVSPDRLDELMVPAYAVRVTDALQANVASRAHDGVGLVTPS